MAGRDHLGPLEARILAAVQALGVDAYGMTIHAQVEKFNRSSLGSVYVTIDRLIEKGYCTAHFGDPTPARGGRMKRYIRLTAAGEEALMNWKTVTENVLREIL